MNICLTGGTGFIGRQLGNTLLQRGHQLTIVARDPAKVANCFPKHAVRLITGDLYHLSEAQRSEIAQADTLAHLAWPGLPNYQARFHLETTLPHEIIFLLSLLEKGLKRLLVTGTCFEYGLQSGCLSEDTPAQPVTAYAEAKARLHDYLTRQSREKPYSLIWTRLFYLHGPGQHPGSLLAQLDHAIDRGSSTFPMSGGEQLRDYLPVSEVATRLANLLENANAHGVVNICSGIPISIRGLVEQTITARNASIRPILGHYPYPAHEPMAFWGNTDKYDALEAAMKQTTKEARR